MEDFGIEWIYIVAPEWADSDRTLPWTCLKSWYFGFSETHYLDVSNHGYVVWFENAIRNIGSNRSDNRPIIEEYLTKYLKRKEWLKFSDLAKVSNIWNNIKVTALVWENGSGKSQLIKQVIWCIDLRSSSIINISHKCRIIDNQILVLGDKNDSNGIFDWSDYFENDILSIVDSSSNKEWIISMFDMLFNIENVYDVEREWSLVFASPSEFLRILNSDYYLKQVVVSLKLILYYINIKIYPINRENEYIYEILEEFDQYFNNKTDNLIDFLVPYLVVLEEIFILEEDDERRLYPRDIEKEILSDLMELTSLFCKTILERVDCCSWESHEQNLLDFDYIDFAKDGNIDNSLPSQKRLRNFTLFSKEIKNTSYYQNKVIRWVDKSKTGIIIGTFKSKSIMWSGLISKILDLQSLFNRKWTKIKLFDIYWSDTEGWELRWLGSYKRNIVYSMQTISSWERSLLCRILFNISNFIENSGLSYVICIDEPDAFLHIRWQRKYLSFLINRLSTTYPNKRFHLIIATHSPFIISDIPENNLLILEKGEDVTKWIIEKEWNSFANTTFDIVSDYMWCKTDETMGDFTKEIIDWYVKEIKDLLIKKRTREKESWIDNKENPYQGKIDELQKKYKIVIEWIGDPILKQYLLLLRG